MLPRELSSSTTFSVILIRPSKVLISWRPATSTRSTRSLSLTGSRESLAPLSGKYLFAYRSRISGISSRLTRLRYPPNTEEKQKNLEAFFGRFPPPSVAKQVPDTVKALGEKYPSIKSWGILGVSIYLSSFTKTNPPIQNFLSSTRNTKTNTTRSTRIVLLGRQSRLPRNIKRLQPLRHRGSSPPGHG